MIIPSNMKRLSLSIFFACLSWLLMAQETIKVNYQGARPTISDFAKAIFLSGDVDDSDCDESSNAAAQAFVRYQKGEALAKGETLTLDQKNGFLLYESKYSDPEDGEYLLKYEMCYWNEVDQKHKLIAYSVASFHNGQYEPGQFDCLIFYRYDNATKQLEQYFDTGLEVEYMTEDGANISYSLPRVGKDITANYWYKSGKKQQVIKWNGHGFSH